MNISLKKKQKEFCKMMRILLSLQIITQKEVNLVMSHISHVPATHPALHAHQLHPRHVPWRWAHVHAHFT